MYSYSSAFLPCAGLSSRNNSPHSLLPSLFPEYESRWQTDYHILSGYSSLSHTTDSTVTTRYLKQSTMASTQSPVLAGPPGDCCVKGVKHFGEPSGETITIAGVQTYISKPLKAKDSSHDKKIILYFADVFGPFYINSQLLQDYYASHGLSRLGSCHIGLLFDSYFSQVLPFLGLTTFSETQSTCTQMKKALIERHGAPSPGNKLKKFFRSGSRKSGKFMVNISSIQKIFQCDFFYIGADAKYSAVG